jgi:rhodanese-related sulfurtransferase
MKTIFLAFFFIINLQCQQKDSHKATNAELQKSKIEIIAAADFKRAISKDKVQLVDVRTPSEYNDGHILNALNINVNDDSFANKIGKLDKTQTVYIYCRSGGRSQNAAKQMEALGFTHIVDLQGGFMNYN